MQCSYLPPPRTLVCCQVTTRVQGVTTSHGGGMHPPPWRDAAFPRSLGARAARITTTCAGRRVVALGSTAQGRRPAAWPFPVRRAPATARASPVGVPSKRYASQESGKCLESGGGGKKSSRQTFTGFSPVWSENGGIVPASRDESRDIIEMVRPKVCTVLSTGGKKRNVYTLNF